MGSQLSKDEAAPAGICQAESCERVDETICTFFFDSVQCGRRDVLASTGGDVERSGHRVSSAGAKVAKESPIIEGECRLTQMEFAKGVEKLSCAFEGVADLAVSTIPFYTGMITGCFLPVMKMALEGYIGCAEELDVTSSVSEGEKEESKNVTPTSHENAESDSLKQTCGSRVADVACEESKLVLESTGEQTTGQNFIF